MLLWELLKWVDAAISPYLTPLNHRTHLRSEAGAEPIYFYGIANLLIHLQNALVHGITLASPFGRALL